MMENEFIPYKEALALKELGFDKVCFSIYMKGELCSRLAEYVDTIEAIKAPLYQQAFRWFREKYGLIVEHTWTMVSTGFEYAIIDKTTNPDNWDDVERVTGFKTYEEAELACLRKLIEIVNQNKDDE